MPLKYEYIFVHCSNYNTLGVTSQKACKNKLRWWRTYINLMGDMLLNKRKERKIFAKSLSIVECHKFFIFPVKMNRRFLRQHIRLIKKEINAKKRLMMSYYIVHALTWLPFPFDFISLLVSLLLSIKATHLNLFQQFLWLEKVS